MDQQLIMEQMVMEYLSGEVSLRTLAKRYKFNYTRIYRWVVAYKKQKKTQDLLKPCEVTPLPGQQAMSPDVKLLREELRIAQIRILLLEATIDIADEQYGTSMRKKAGPRQS